MIILDGDVLKKIVNDCPGYSKEDRRKRAMKYALLCKMLTDQGLIVVCCTIAMFDEVRVWNRENNKGYVEIFLNTPLNVLQQRDQKGMYSKYSEGNFINLAGIDLDIEFPKNPDIEIVNDGLKTVEECTETIMTYQVNLRSNYQRDTNYWNEYYHSSSVDQEPTKFALSVSKTLQSGKSLLELGCGNGRDSLFFSKLGINVTAIDASDYIINQLKEKNNNVWFVCDDFVCSTIIKAKQYDYIYSRFSLHAIDQKQQREMLINSYNALKEEGLMFIETRGIHDELYGKGRCVGDNAFLYNGHYRRFIVFEELSRELKQIGFKIEYQEENKGFAPHNGADPIIIRFICRKE